MRNGGSRSVARLGRFSRIPGSTGALKFVHRGAHTLSLSAVVRERVAYIENIGAKGGSPMGVSGTSLLTAPCLWCGPSPSPSRPPSGTMTGRDLLSDPWRERMEGGR